MKRLFENLFYRTYLIALINKDNTHHLDSAIILFCIPQMLIVSGTYGWVKLLDNNLHLENYQAFLLGLAWCFCNGLYFYKHFERIKEQYSNETKEQRRTGFILWIVYVLVSVGSIAFPLYLLKK